jgi:hypothetical protein
MRQDLKQLDNYKELNRAYFDTLLGSKVLDDLEMVFPTRTIKRVDGRVDQYATIYADGQRDVIDYIRRRINDGAVAR